jgi:nuclear transport factor 2 (NTF2) superfamily protein
MAESRPPLPPFTLQTATQKVRMAEMRGIPAIRSVSDSPIRRIAAGETGRNS